MNTFLQDLRFSLRMMLKNFKFTIMVVLTLALGIGANTSIYTVMNTLMMRSLPVKNPHELVLLSMDGDRNQNPTFSYPIYENLRNGNRSLSGLCASREGTSRRRMIASGFGGTETEFIQAQEVSGNFFSVLGVSASHGRTLSPEDDRKENPQPVVVISDHFWKRRFGSDPSVIGKTITIDDIAFTIIGVSPPEFFGIEVGGHPDIWYPLQMILQVDANPDPRMQMLSPNMWWLRIMGRVPAGIDARQAQTELDGIYKQSLPEQERSKVMLAFHSGNNGWTDLRGQLRQPLLILMVAACFVMLIACANVASLLLARASARIREFSIRNALGASRFQLIRQMLIESMLLAILGGLLGILFAQWGTDFLLYYAKIRNDSVSFNVTPDKNVLFFTIAISLLTGFLSGFPYALRYSRVGSRSFLTSSSIHAGNRSTKQRLNRTLVVIQLTLSMILLIGAGLFVRTVENLTKLDTGFNRENLILFDFDFTKNLDNPSRTSFYKTLLERVAPLPGVQAASLSMIQPLSQAGWSDQVNTGETPSSSQKDPSRICYGMRVGPHYFQTMGTPILNGRDFDSRDDFPLDSSKTIRTLVINDSMAKRFFPDENPVGKQFKFSSNSEQSYEIVGIVKDTKYNTLRESNRSIFYVPFFQDSNDPGMNVIWGMTFLIRTSADPRPLISNIQTLVREVDSTVQIRNLRTMEEVVENSLHQEWTIAQLGGFFSAIALALACLGLYSVLSFTVTQRTREIGIRMALGAQRFNVLSLIVGQGLILAIIGLSLGLFSAFALTRIVSNLLYGVSPTDPTTFVGVSSLLALVALLSCYLPARRATKVDPMTALRCE